MLTDVMMPGMNGVELSRQVSGRWPALPVMYMSGFPGDALPSTRDELAIVTKPFTPDDLAAAIRRRLDAPG
jgi:two-component system NtrC family sensor kinase